MKKVSGTVSVCNLVGFSEKQLKFAACEGAMWKGRTDDMWEEKAGKNVTAYPNFFCEQVRQWIICLWKQVMMLE